ncbi:pirin family protein [Luteimonas sp. SX5]|uniref:Pirin family protein n=1 Tax=Luteimonas galliterrae TaxID=2940486 RepID=A0ABT0MKY0_9GAMM|nr:pirin family protein [Luteimonas galliterrae]MCL1635550.1 pirin family protein [Luteimonas galliterrae]
MRILRSADERGRVDVGWLDSRHTFSFGHYHDPQWMGFGPLRVINEDRVAPGGGFAPHRHANMEIISYVLSGGLAHRDSLSDAGGVLRPGELQWMSAGRGIEHSEFNGSDREPVHFLQIWIQPDRSNTPPAYAQRAFDPQARRGNWALLASPDGADGSIAIRQQAWLRGVLLENGQTAQWPLQADRRYWLHLARGEIEVDGQRLSAGDALGFAEEGDALRIVGAGQDMADVLLFDLPE